MSVLSYSSARVSTFWWGHLLWVLAGAILGFVVAAVFAGLLGLPRAWYLVVYVMSVSAFLYGYIRWSGINVGGWFRHHWLWGVIAAAVVSPLVVFFWSAALPGIAHAARAGVGV